MCFDVDLDLRRLALPRQYPRGVDVVAPDVWRLALPR
jgi:hypothetical protein